MHNKKLNFSKNFYRNEKNVLFNLKPAKKLLPDDDQTDLTRTLLKCIKTMASSMPFY